MNEEGKKRLAEHLLLQAQQIGFEPDYGVFVRLAYPNVADYFFRKLSIFTFAKVNENMFTLLSSQIVFGYEFMITLDFDLKLLPAFLWQLKNSIPPDADEWIEVLLNGNTDTVDFGESKPLLNCDAYLGTEIENRNEVYVPFIIKRFCGNNEI